MLLNMDDPDHEIPSDNDDFAALEERVLRAVETVKAERAARLAAEARTAALHAEFAASAPRIELQNQELTVLREEVATLRAERIKVRERVERMLSQLDAIESTMQPQIRIPGPMEA